MYLNDEVNLKANQTQGLTLTWDVFKFLNPPFFICCVIMININMRCI